MVFLTLHHYAIVITFVSTVTYSSMLYRVQAYFWGYTVYNVGTANLDLMNETLQSVDWNSTLSSLDINDSWVCFKAIYQDAIDRCVPVYKAKQKKN